MTTYFRNTDTGKTIQLTTTDNIVLSMHPDEPPFDDKFIIKFIRTYDGPSWIGITSEGDYPAPGPMFFTNNIDMDYFASTFNLLNRGDMVEFMYCSQDDTFHITDQGSVIQPPTSGYGFTPQLQGFKFPPALTINCPANIKTSLNLFGKNVNDFNNFSMNGRYTIAAANITINMEPKSKGLYQFTVALDINIPTGTTGATDATGKLIRVAIENATTSEIIARDDYPVHSVDGIALLSPLRFNCTGVVESSTTADTNLVITVTNPFTTAVITVSAMTFIANKFQSSDGFTNRGLYAY